MCFNDPDISAVKILIRSIRAIVTSYQASYDRPFCLPSSRGAIDGSAEPSLIALRRAARDDARKSSAQPGTIPRRKEPRVTQPEPSALPTARVSVPHPYLCLMGLYFGGFTGMYSETALNIALPQLSQAFGVELAVVQWLVVGYMLAIGIVLPFTSLLMKWVSARKITLFALGSFLVGALISGCAPSFEVALTGRVIQGIGTGLVLPLMFSMVMEVIPPHKIGTAMGISALVIMFAPAIGPTLAGFLIGALSWRWIFFSFAIVLVIGIVFTCKFMVNPYEETRPPIDALSVVTSCLGFGGIVLGVGVASLFGWLSAPTIASLVVGIASLAVYATRQLKMSAPVLDLRAFGIQGFRVGAVCLMLNFGITLSAMYVLPQFYQNSMMLAVAFAGIIMLPGGVINAFVSMMAGRIYDRIGARVPAITGFALSLVGAVLLMQATPTTSLAYVIVCHIIMMIGVPLAMSPCQTHALSSLPHRLSIDGSSILNTLQQVLGAVCTAVATNLLATGQTAYFADGGTNSALAFMTGSHWGFAFTLVLAALGLLFALRIKAPSRVAQPEEAREHTAASPLASLMKTDVYTLADTDTALDALRLFTGKGISGAPVVDEDGSLVGFLSDGDVIGALAHQNPNFTSFYAVVTDSLEEGFDDKVATLAHTTVGQLATKEVLTVATSDDLRDVCTLLASHHLKKAPVMDGTRMVGVINRSDALAHAVALYDRKLQA